MRYLTLAAIIFLMPKTALAACVAERAVYINQENKEFSLRFSKMPQPKAWSNIGVDLAGPKLKLKFEMTASLGYAQNYLSALPEKENDEGNTVFFFDRALKVMPLPQSGHAAPEYVFAPQLGAALWYNETATQRIFLPTGMWKLSSCRK
jgi:hypothetical protein